jgi:hypothetical protein
VRQTGGGVFQFGLISFVRAVICGCVAMTFLAGIDADSRPKPCEFNHFGFVFNPLFFFRFATLPFRFFLLPLMLSIIIVIVQDFGTNGSPSGFVACVLSSPFSLSGSLGFGLFPSHPLCPFVRLTFQLLPFPLL